MGCSVITICCFPVLLLASIAANMKVTTDMLSTADQTNEETSIPTMSPMNSITSHGVTDKIKSNYTESFDYKINSTNMVTKENCRDSTNAVNNKNCSSDITTIISAGNDTKTTITFRDFKEYRYYKNLFDILPYAPNVPGIITNSLTIIVAANIKPLHTSEIYMIALGCADFITVVSRGVFLAWYSNTNKMSAAGCNIPRYVIQVALVFSNMTLMAWTLERFIAVKFPIKLATWCSIRNTKITLSLLLVICLLLAIPYWTEFNLIILTNGIATEIICFESDFMKTRWSNFASVYYVYIPMVFVCVCNITILYRLTVMAKSRMSMASNQETIDKKASETRRMTILLLTISGCFVVLHIPHAIILVYRYFYSDFAKMMFEDPEFFAKYLFFSTLGFHITDYQNCVNFFLYCISGNKFRTTFLKIFCKPFMKNKRTQATESSATRTTKI